MSKDKDDKKLTDKQQRFCEEYLIDLNATQAAIRAGYSEKTANEQGAQNLAKLSIQEKIQGLLAERSKRTEITADRVLQEYARIAFFDIRKIYNEDGGFKKVQELDDDAAAVLAGIETYEEKVFEAVVGETKKVKIHNKINALDSLAKHLGMFEADNKQKEKQTVVSPLTDGQFKDIIETLNGTKPS